MEINIVTCLGYPSVIKGALRADLRVTFPGPYRLRARLEPEDFKISDMEGINPDRARTLNKVLLAISTIAAVPKCNRASGEKERWAMEAAPANCSIASRC